MRNIMTKIILASVLFLLSQFFFNAMSQGNAPEKRAVPVILLVHSYHAGYPWVDAITKGVMDALKDKKVELKIIYMDTKRNTSQDFKGRAGKTARDIIDRERPDAVITADDNAQILVARNYIGKGPYFVFCGINADPAEYGFPAANITGIIERPHFEESLELLKSIAPSVKKIAVMSDDDPTSLGTLLFMQAAEVPFKVEAYKIIDSFDMWKERVKEFSGDVDAICIYTYHTLKGADGGQSVPPEEVMAWTYQNCTVPTVGFLEFAINDGLLCGVVESAEEHGQAAAEMAMGLIEGKPIEDLPVRTAKKGIKMINIKTAKKLGLNIDQSVLAKADKVIK